MRWYANTGRTHCLPGRVSRLRWMLCEVRVAGSRVCGGCAGCGRRICLEQGRKGENSIYGRDGMERWVACSMPALQCRDRRRVGMANTKEQQLQAFARRAARVSRALWPTNVRRAI